MAFLHGMVSSALPDPDFSDTAGRFAKLLRELGVTHVISVPDNTSAPLLQALEQGAPGKGPEVRLLIATREGEAIGLAAGLWMGGATPTVLIQNTGLLEAGDALRGTLSRMGAPVLLLITCRGFAKARRAGIDPSPGPLDREILVREDLDSVAHMTEATLRAWGIPFSFLREACDLETIRDAFVRAEREERPVAVLLDTSFD